mmetsp:Transcript_47836/g.119764  ORF Transcript_47836/g.119764 Transcript_47836/m.119764 type:complete len:204 (+) Transcript_47836:162-773(+)
MRHLPSAYTMCRPPALVGDNGALVAPGRPSWRLSGRALWGGGREPAAAVALFQGGELQGGSRYRMLARKVGGQPAPIHVDALHDALSELRLFGLCRRRVCPAVVEPGARARARLAVPGAEGHAGHGDVPPARMCLECALDRSSVGGPDGVRSSLRQPLQGYAHPVPRASIVAELHDERDMRLGGEQRRWRQRGGGSTACHLTP